MRLAAQWGEIQVAPSIKMLPGERHREHVVKFEEEARYLAAAPEPLGSVAAILLTPVCGPTNAIACGGNL